MELERKHLCPLLKKRCIQLDCEWFIKVAGTDPQDKDKQIEEWGCAINFQFMGLLEVAKRVSGGLDGVQKSTESFRNEMVAMNHAVDPHSAYARGVAEQRAALVAIPAVDCPAVEGNGAGAIRSGRQ